MHATLQLTDLPQHTKKWSASTRRWNLSGGRRGKYDARWPSVCCVSPLTEGFAGSPSERCTTHIIGVGKNWKRWPGCSLKIDVSSLWRERPACKGLGWASADSQFSILRKSNHLIPPFAPPPRILSTHRSFLLTWFLSRSSLLFVPTGRMGGGSRGGYEVAIRGCLERQRHAGRAWQ